MKPQKKENLDESLRVFKAEGLTYESFNNGVHWRVAGIDYYPTTQRWNDPKNDFTNMGVESLIRYIRTREHKKTSSIRVLTSEQIFEVARKCKKTNLAEICDAIHKEIYL